MIFRILHQDEALVAIDKPAGFHVHPPENGDHRIPRSTNCLALLRDQLGKHLYPVHRLDRATSGVLVFALEPEAAASLARAFREQEVTKTYFAITRGWTADEGLVDHPLKSEHAGMPPKDSRTSYLTVGKVELPWPVGDFRTARYSLVRVQPHTGRMHQIRRHFAHLSHPLIGDTVYGDGKHNRIFREKLGEKGLFLKAHTLEFRHPRTGARLRVQSRWNHLWHRAFDLFGICPCELRQESC